MAPALLFVTGVNAFKGYFQGHGDMRPTAMSNIVEAIVNISAGLGISFLFISSGFSVSVASIGAGAALTLGELAALLTLYIYYKRAKKPKPGARIRSKNILIREILKCAMPILLGSLLISLCNTADIFVMMRRLTSFGGSNETANELYGMFTGIVLVIVNVPSLVTFAISTNIVPTIAMIHETRSKKRLDTAVPKIFKMDAMLTVPAFAFMMFMPREMITVLFGAARAAESAYLLRTECICVVFLSFSVLSSAVLQSLGKNLVPVISMTAGMTAKLIVSYTIIGKYGIIGAPLGNIAYGLTVSLINFCFLKRCGVKINLFKAFALPSVFAAAGVIFAKSLSGILKSFADARLGMLSALFLGTLMYCAFLYIFTDLRHELKEMFKLKKEKGYGRKETAA